MLLSVSVGLFAVAADGGGEEVVLDAALRDDVKFGIDIVAAGEADLAAGQVELTLGDDQSAVHGVDRTGKRSSFHRFFCEY